MIEIRSQSPTVGAEDEALTCKKDKARESSERRGKVKFERIGCEKGRLSNGATRREKGKRKYYDTYETSAVQMGFQKL